MSLFTQRLVAAMRIRKVNGAELARKTGLSAAYISELRTATATDPPLQVAVKIVKALKVPLHWLAGMAPEGDLECLDEREMEFLSVVRDALVRRKRCEIAERKKVEASHAD